MKTQDLICLSQAFHLGKIMHKFLTALLLAAPLVSVPGLTKAEGCLKGAAVGGVVGHVAGKHALIGAAGGCAIEHHREKVAKEKSAERQSTQPQQQATDSRKDSHSQQKKQE